MTEHIRVIKAKELKIGDEILECGCFWEVKDIEQKETSITGCYQVENSIIDAFWDKDDLLAIKTHRQNEDATNPSYYTQSDKGITGPDGQCPSYFNGALDVLQDKLSTEQFEGYLFGNALKHLLKGKDEKQTENIEEAEWYMRKLIEFRRNG